MSWTIDQSRIIAERLMEWQVTEHNGRLFCVAGGSVPQWPTDIAGAAQALAAIQMDGVSVWQRWEAEKRMYTVTLHHQHDSRYPVISQHRNWPEAVMGAVWKAVGE
jgi:hypothetical protein